MISQVITTMITIMINNDHVRDQKMIMSVQQTRGFRGSCSMFLTMGSLVDWISITGERISTTSELGVAHISPPEGDDCPLNGGGPAAPGPPGLPPRLFRFAHGSPLRLASQKRGRLPGEKRVCKTMGEAPAVGAKGSRGLAGGQPLAVVHGPPRRRAGRESPAQVFSSRVEDPLAWGWRSRPQSPAGLTTLRSKV